MTDDAEPPDGAEEGAFDKATFFVALKLLLRQSEQLLITHDVFGDWDLPGGRLATKDSDTALEEVLSRKVAEELGTEVEYTLGQPRALFRHERREAALGGHSVRIFAVGFEAAYLGGSIRLGRHHDRYEWVEAATFDAGSYFVGGWLSGVEEYQRSMGGR